MFKIVLFAFCTLSFFQKASTPWHVKIALTQPASNKEIILKIETKNLTGKPVRITKNRTQDYKREKIPALGNYIIAIEKWDLGDYKLFEPSADIDHFYSTEEYITIKKGLSINDTLHINGRSFSRTTESNRGFPSGKYRLKIYFNADYWATGESNPSNTIDFRIE
jgi:hypothetical protein